MSRTACEGAPEHLIPQVLGLSAEANLRPKLRFLATSVPLSPRELLLAIQRAPLVLGSSLEKVRGGRTLPGHALPHLAVSFLT